MPLRRIPRNYRSVTGHVPSTKNGRMVAYESTLERDFYLLQEFRSGIRSFTEQPVVVKYYAGGRMHRHVPDAILEYAAPDRFGRRFELVDIKYRSDIADHWEEYKPSFKAAMAYARERTWRYSLCSEREIRSPELSNAALLVPLRGRSIPAISDEIADLARTPRTISELIEAVALSDAAETLRAILVLLAVGRLSANLRVALTKQTEVWCTLGAAGGSVS